LKPATHYYHNLLEELTLSIDEETGEYARLRNSSTPFGRKRHEYPEEVFIVRGRLYDRRSACGWKPGTMPADHLERFTVPSPPTVGCVVLELSFPNKRNT
jgi:hypothetical protein